MEIEVPDSTNHSGTGGGTEIHFCEPADAGDDADADEEADVFPYFAPHSGAIVGVDYGGEVVFLCWRQKYFCVGTKNLFPQQGIRNVLL